MLACNFFFSVYGKFLESIEKRTKSVLCNNIEKVERLSSLPNFTSITRINERLCIVHLKLIEVPIIRPYLIGFTILEFSKHFMYDSFYNFFQKKLSTKIKLCFSGILKKK